MRYHRLTMAENHVERFARLLSAGHCAIAITTTEESEVVDMVRAHCRQRGDFLWEWDLIGGLRCPLNSGPEPGSETTNPAGAIFFLARRELPSVMLLLDVGPHLSDPHTLRALRALLESARRCNGHVVLCDATDGLPPVVRAHVTPFEMSLPDRDQIEVIVRRTLKELHRRSPIEIELSSRQYELIIKNLGGLSTRQIEQVVREVVSEDRRLDSEDINHVLAGKRRLMSRSTVLEYVESPASLDDIGGLDRLKTWLAQRERSFEDAAIDFGLLPPRGVLMLGVQGAGKSLCAKAIATAWKRPLLRMDPGALYDRFVGESERRLRDALRQAEATAPVVLWIDEIEKAFASAAAQSTDGGLSQRMFGTLLTWMQDHRMPVFLVATANNIDALPPELLRKGRFDEVFFVDLPTDAARRQIFAIHLRRRKQDLPRFDLAELSEAAEGFSGAEIEQAVLSGLHMAFAGGRKLSQRDLLEAIGTSPPLSVTMAERVEVLRQWAQGRCVPAE
ncbi:MAG: AAA family ATPase [Leptolyngbya sp. PLA3]|nr:MAG: AAA family ATPase [Cyanobacteria bacterium CYA]MCE7967640.1 AAA family ATPase [Leptolyngbya sp. PL-A3]